MVNFFFKYRVLFVKIFIFVIVSFIFSKEIFLLNEEMLLIIAFFLFLFATYDIFSRLLKNELDSRAQNIITTVDKLWCANMISYEFLDEICTQVVWIGYYCLTVHNRVKRAQRRFEYYTLTNSNKELQEQIIDSELRIICFEQIKFLKDCHFFSVTRLGYEFTESNFQMEDFTEAQVDALPLLE